jgi:hypothetical protein
MAAAVYTHAPALDRGQSHELVLDNDAGPALYEGLDASFGTHGSIWQPQWDADEADEEHPGLKQPQQHTDDADEGGIPVVDSEETAEDDHTLSTRYAAMLVDRSETELFDQCNSIPADKHEAELCRVLCDTFSGYLANQDEHNLLDSNQMIQQIAYHSNYAVESVVRVMNRQHYRMQQAFAENYRIDATRTVYHGTCERGASSITATGFKGAAGKRTKFGRGIYTSPIIWEALGYAKPYDDARQVFLVVELLQGPTALGSEDQVRECCVCYRATRPPDARASLRRSTSAWIPMAARFSH